MLTRMTRMARMLTHMLTRMTRWLAYYTHSSLPNTMSQNIETAYHKAR